MRVNNISIFLVKFQRTFDFFQAISQKSSIFQGKFLKNFDFSRQIFEKFRFFGQFKKNFDFPGKHCSFTAISGQIILFLFKMNHFRTNFQYIIRYNNISRTHDPHASPKTPPAQNLGGSRPQPPRIDASDLRCTFHSFICSGHFYSAPSSPLLLGGASDYSTDTVSEFHAEAHYSIVVLEYGGS